MGDDKVHVGLVGFGRMGMEIFSEAERCDDCEVVSVLIKSSSLKNVSCRERVNVFLCDQEFEDSKKLNIGDVIRDFVQSVDIVIYFSSGHEFFQSLLWQCQRDEKPIVIGSTNFSQEDKKFLVDCEDRTLMLFDENMSLGVAMIKKLIPILSSLKEEGWDFSLTDTHHRHKLDSPSGTARSLERCMRSEGIENINIASLRAGSVIGEHTLDIYGEGEEMHIRHLVLDRSIFARGALKAARFLIFKKRNENILHGLFSMRDVFH